jgi:hypothetical protein
MPTRRIQRGPQTGGPPVGFQNSPAFNELYVDGLTNQLMVGTGISGATAVQQQQFPAVVTFANLPTPAVEGTLAVVTDATLATWGSVIVGGGANRVLAYYNGTAWTIAAH